MIKHSGPVHTENRAEPGPARVAVQQHELLPGEKTKQISPAFSSIPDEKGKNRPRFDIISNILFILVIAMSITIVMIKRWRLAVEQAVRAEADKTNAELAILKAQINPHFLFNTLNNIYSQAVMHDEKTPESIMKLSNIMRYVTDDANNDFVSLLSESNFISDYIELQRLRLGSKVTLDFAINGKLEDKFIAPLILITFIENVFKYGISNSEASAISIELRAYKDSIAFFSRNKLFPLKHQLESTGIGIINTKKRLDHLYPGKHSLTIKEEDGFFSVHLILQS
jgi:sensor histidine kinase YesM